jgi:hypothetical protein
MHESHVFDPVTEIDLSQIGLIRALAGTHRLRLVHLLWPCSSSPCRHPTEGGRS